ncbi:hypothetical protein IEK_05846 [Bacillus toyonensis]|uniref:hypothetical protein n=1 Tax=Bacillus toyonensis TaxID=155322 RepID=UPI00027BEC40|nr:hypothetical protein [Bacillus toyonensis]EJV42180.1 hypothetical protein IEK_05846 [Bacillus toyonensis]
MGKDKIEQLETLAKPLVDLLKEQYDTHCQVVIDSDRVRIVEDVVGVPVGEDGNLQLKVDVDTKEANENIKELTAIVNECEMAIKQLENRLKNFNKMQSVTFKDFNNSHIQSVIRGTQV